LVLSAALYRGHALTDDPPDHGGRECPALGPVVRLEPGDDPTAKGPPQLAHGVLDLGKLRHFAAAD
jgi:hypothetical protein